MFLTVTLGPKDHFRPNVGDMQTPPSVHSDAVRQREVVLLPVSDERAAVDLAADSLLHHLPPVELQARVHRVHALSGQVRAGGWEGGPGPRQLRQSPIILNGPRFWGVSSGLEFFSGAWAVLCSEQDSPQSSDPFRLHTQPCAPRAEASSQHPVRPL